MKERLIQLFEKIRAVVYRLNPTPVVGGLEIADTALRLVILKKGVVNHWSLRLPPGIVENGALSDAALFRKALLRLRAEAALPPGPFHVVVSLSPEQIFFQSLSIPRVEEEKQEEVLLLNVQIAAPRPLDELRYGYEPLRPKEGASVGSLEYLVGFASKKTVDDFVRALKEAALMPITIEFPALSLSRALVTAPAIAHTPAALLLALTGDGVLIVGVREGAPFFERFLSWQTLRTGKASEIAAALKDELRRVENFYLHHEGRPVEKIYITGHGPVEEITHVLGDGRVEGILVPLDEQVIAVPLELLIAYGAALRGASAPMRDAGLTLAPGTAKTDYLEALTIRFFRLWRLQILVVFSVLICALAVSDFFLGRYSASLEEKAAGLLEGPAAAEVGALAKEAHEFNAFVDLLGTAKNQTPRWSLLYETVTAAATAENIRLDRIFVNNASVLLMVGRAPSETSIVAFKTKLAGDSRLGDLNLPLADIKQSPDGTFAFSMGAGIKKLDF